MMSFPLRPASHRDRQGHARARKEAGRQGHVVNQTMNIVNDVRDDDRPTSEYGLKTIES